MQSSRFRVLLAGFTLLCAAACNQKNQLPQLGKNPIPEVIQAMTLDEKTEVVVGMGMIIEGIPAGMLPPNDPADDKVPEKVPGAAGRTHAIPRLGIPSLVLSDGPAGVRINPKRKGSSKTYYATAFPVATLVASSWDTAMARQMGVAFGSEVRDFGIDVLLAPGINIHRNPLGGRNFEYYSEDPLVAGHMAAAIVRGVQANGVGTSVKHFAANNQEFNRMNLNTHVGERAMRELYLRNFQVALKHSQPWTIMSSYNLLNGTYTSERRDLLTDILRKEWGFKGLVMSDWWAGKDAVAQINAGNDLIMPGNAEQKKAIRDGIKSGKLSMERLDECVARVLELALKSPAFSGYKYSDEPNIKQDAQVSREAAANGMVLLKNNDGALPLSSGGKIALFGNTSYDLIAGGTGSGDVNKPYVISLDQGLTNAAYKADESLISTYKNYIAAQKAARPKAEVSFFVPPPIAEMPLASDLLQQQAAAADVAVVTIGRNAGEGGDRKVEGDFTLTAAEQSMIKGIADAFHAKGKKVVVVLNIGGVIETASWRDGVDAVLLAWQPGMEGGNAIADVLTGKVNPSGKLATTFPVRYSDEPSAKSFPGKELPSADTAKANPIFGRPSEVTYEEGIYVGYRYYNTFGVKPAYEFGYGLSYTDFTYGNMKLSATTFNDRVVATVTVTNSGNTAGKEVVQLYLKAPTSRMDKPAAELKAFAKTGLLKPGESQTLSFHLTAADLASFHNGSSSWVADAGIYSVMIGASSLNIRQTASFKLPKDMVVEKVHQALVPQVTVNELKPGK